MIFILKICVQCDQLQLFGLTFSTSRHATGHTQGYLRFEVDVVRMWDGNGSGDWVWGAVQVLVLGVLKVRAKWPATNWPPNQTDPIRTEPL